MKSAGKSSTAHQSPDSRSGAQKPPLVSLAIGDKRSGRHGRAVGSAAAVEVARRDLEREFEDPERWDGMS